MKTLDEYFSAILTVSSLDEKVVPALLESLARKLYPRCPQGCSGIHPAKNSRVNGILTCMNCQAEFGVVLTAGDSTRVVKDQWDVIGDMEGARYYDFYYPVPLGDTVKLSRVHGWFNPHNRKIVQSG